MRFRDGVRSRKGQSLWIVFAGAGGLCGEPVWTTRQRVLSARLELGPCDLATGSRGWSLRGGLPCVCRDAQKVLSTVMPGGG